MGFTMLQCLIWPLARSRCLCLVMTPLCCSCKPHAKYRQGFLDESSRCNTWALHKASVSRP